MLMCSSCISPLGRVETVLQWLAFQKHDVYFLKEQQKMLRVAEMAVRPEETKDEAKKSTKELPAGSRKCG